MDSFTCSASLPPKICWRAASQASRSVAPKVTTRCMSEPAALHIIDVLSSKTKMDVLFIYRPLFKLGSQIIEQGHCEIESSDKRLEKCKPTA
jgi:hypothetical protein